jgi:hypothetical protein
MAAPLLGPEVPFIPQRCEEQLDPLWQLRGNFFQRHYFFRGHDHYPRYHQFARYHQHARYHRCTRYDHIFQQQH